MDLPRHHIAERFFDEGTEFSHSISSSECESLGLEALLALGTPDDRERFASLSLGYGDARGGEELRAEVAALYDSVSENDVVVVPGSEALMLANLAAVRPGDHAIVSTPRYAPLSAWASAIGCEVSEWMPDGGVEWSWTAGGLEPLFRHETRLLILNIPHNPTGWVPSEDEFAAILDAARARRVRVFCDEVFRGIEPAGCPRLPSVVDADERGVVVSSLSKTFGLAGIRLGWIVSRDREFVQRVRRLRCATSAVSSPVCELLGAIALRAHGAILPERRELVGKNVERFEAFLSRRSTQFSWTAPAAGTVGFARVLGESASALCDRALARSGVMALPSPLFEAPDDHVRIGFGHYGFPEALVRFEESISF